MNHPHPTASRHIPLALSCIAIAAAAMAFGASPSSAAEADSEVYISVPAADAIEQFRFFSPSKLWRDEATFRIDAPGRAGRPIDRDELDLTLTLTGPDDRTAQAPVRFDRPRGRDGDDAVPREAEVTTDLSDWPDGEVTVDLNIEHDPDNEVTEAFDDPSSQQFRIVRAKVAAIAEPYREEIRTWLDDHNRAEPIWGHIPQWSNLAAALDNPESPYEGLRGFLLRSYDNPQLRRKQPYTLYIPDSIDADEPMPLMILLHGSGGDYRNLIADYAAGQRFEEHPMLIANAGAFFHQEYRHMALNDVRWVIEDTKAKYDVDPDRIYVQGISLGGRGSLELAALMPDTFAAICPQGIYGVIGDMIDPATAVRETDRVATRLAARVDIRTFLPNLINTPTEIIFGWYDRATPPFHALTVDMTLRHAGATVRTRGFDAGHNITVPEYDWASTRKWLLEHQRNHEPRRAALRVTNLRFNRADWVEVHALEDYSDIGDVDAHIEEDSEALRVKLHNIAAVTLDPPFEYEHIKVNGGPPLPAPDGPVTLVAGADGRIEVGEWETPADEAPTKRPGRAGPLWDAWSEPVVYTWDDQGGGNRRLLEISARVSSRWDMSFGDRHLPVKSFADVDEETREEANVILFASPGRLAELVDETYLRYPLQAAGGDGDDDEAAESPASWAEADLRIALLPSPWASDRYLVVVETTAGRPFNLHELGWWDNGLRTDWVVAATRDGGGGRPGRGRPGVDLLSAGVYDQQWEPAAQTDRDYRASTNDLLHTQQVEEAE